MRSERGRGVVRGGEEEERKKTERWKDRKELVTKGDSYS